MPSTVLVAAPAGPDVPPTAAIITAEAIKQILLHRLNRITPSQGMLSNRAIVPGLSNSGNSHGQSASEVTTGTRIASDDP